MRCHTASTERSLRAAALVVLSGEKRFYQAKMVALHLLAPCEDPEEIPLPSTR